MSVQRLDLGLTAPASGCGDACGCSAPAASATGASTADTPRAETAVTELAVTGMTCSHCIGAVTDELSALPGVQDVSVDLVVGGASRVTVRSSAALDDAAVRTAVGEAGYAVAD